MTSTYQSMADTGVCCCVRVCVCSVAQRGEVRERVMTRNQIATTYTTNAHHTHACAVSNKQGAGREPASSTGVPSTAPTPAGTPGSSANTNAIAKMNKIIKATHTCMLTTRSRIGIHARACCY